MCSHEDATISISWNIHVPVAAMMVVPEILTKVSSQVSHTVSEDQQ